MEGSCVAIGGCSLVSAQHNRFSPPRLCFFGQFRLEAREKRPWVTSLRKISRSEAFIWHSSSYTVAPFFENYLTASAVFGGPTGALPQGFVGNLHRVQCQGSADWRNRRAHHVPAILWSHEAPKSYVSRCAKRADYAREHERLHTSGNRAAARPAFLAVQVVT